MLVLSRLLNHRRINTWQNILVLCVAVWLPVSLANPFCPNFKHATMVRGVEDSQINMTEVCDFMLID